MSEPTLADKMDAYKKVGLSRGPNVEVFYNSLVEKTRVIATEDIKTGMLVYQGTHFISFDSCGDRYAAPLVTSLSLLRNKLRTTLTEELAELYPRTPKEMHDSMFNFHKDRALESVIAEISKCEEHIIHEKIRLNNFLEKGKIYIYLQGSKFNHSCSPNCFSMFKDGVNSKGGNASNTQSMIVRAVKNIKKGEEITICYFPELLFMSNSEARSKAVLKRGSFKCNCNSCKGIAVASYSVVGAKTCNTCGTASDKLLLCGKCKTSAYCNASCQKLHWIAGHSKFCCKKEVRKRDCLCYTCVIGSLQAYFSRQKLASFGTPDLPEIRDFLKTCGVESVIESEQLKLIKGADCIEEEDLYVF